MLELDVFLFLLLLTFPPIRGTLYAHEKKNHSCCVRQTDCQMSHNEHELTYTLDMPFSSFAK